MINGNFKQNFNQSLKKLIIIKEAIEKNLQNKQEFSSIIIRRLEVINDRVIELGENIKLLKKQIPNLQGQSKKIVNQIDDKSDEIDALKAQISKLNEQLKESRIYNGLKESKEVVDYRRQLNDLKTEHTDNLQKQQQVNDAKQNANLKAQQEENENKQKELIDEITAIKNNITTRENDTAKLNAAKEELEQKIFVLTSEIQKLKDDNYELTSIITNATSTIDAVVKLLEDLKNKETFEPGELEAKIRKIEESIIQINNEFLPLPQQYRPTQQYTPMQQDTSTPQSQLQQNTLQLFPPEPPKLEPRILEPRILEPSIPFPPITPRNETSPKPFPRTFNVLPSIPTEQQPPRITQLQPEINSQLQPEINSQLQPPRIPPQKPPRIPPQQPPRIPQQQQPEINSQLQPPKISQQQPPKISQKQLTPISEENELDDIDVEFPDQDSSEYEGGKKTKKNRKQKRGKKTKKNRKQKGGYIYKSNSKRRNIRTTTSRKSPTTPSRKSPTKSSRRNSARVKRI
jgi:hypothetical protein